LKKIGLFIVTFGLIIAMMMPIQAVNAHSPDIIIYDNSPNTDKPKILNDGDIIYLQFSESNPPFIQLQMSLIGGLTDLSPSTDLPKGSKFDREHMRFTWNLDSLCKKRSDLGPDCMRMLPQSFGINFVATGPGAIARKSVFVVVELPSSPSAKIELDRTGYQPGSTATITITDPHAVRNAIYQNEFDGSRILVKIVDPLGNLATIFADIPFKQSPSDRTKFIGTFQVPRNIAAGSLMVASYNDFNVKADIGLTVQLNSNMYNIDERPRLTVADASGDYSSELADTIIVNLRPSVGKTLPIKLIETARNTRVFIANLPSLSEMASKFGFDNIPDSFVITAQYKNQKDQAIVIHPKFEFSSAKYGAMNFATLHLLDKRANMNKDMPDMISIIVNSSTTGQEVTSLLQETGPNTGEFYSIYMIPLISDPKVLEQFPNGLGVGDGATITATLTGISGTFTKAMAGVVIPPGPGPVHPPGLNGTGSNGVSANTIRTIFSGIQAISCASYGNDTDWDGICDNWESSPYTSGPLLIPYPTGGSTYLFNTPYNTCDPTCANKNHKDVYVEIDYANGFSPSTTAIANVKAKFNAALNSEFDTNHRNPDGTNGIRLHVKVSDNVGTSPLTGNTVDTWSNSNGNDINPPTSAASCSSPQNSFSKIKQCGLGVGFNSFTNLNKTLAWQQIAHYVYWGNKQTHDSGSSGLAEVVGDDIFVSLGSFGGGSASVDVQQGTLMHELGHNLGLNHGGGLSTYPTSTGDPANYAWYSDAWINCKPQYISVMSHSRQITNAFSGDTLDYSHGWFSPANILQSVSNTSPSLKEDGIPKPSSAPSGTAVTIYFGYDQGGGVRGQQTVQGDPSTFPNTNPSNGVNIVPNKIDWDHDGTFTTSPALDGPNDIFDVGLGHRCARADGNDPHQIPVPNNDQIYDHNDWRELILDFRNWNPAGIATGSSAASPGMSIDELNTLRVAGVVWLNDGIHNLNSHFFNGDSDAIKKQFQDALIDGPNSVAMLANNTATAKDAADKLAKLRLLMDSSRGGYDKDDLITEAGQKLALERLDNNLAVFELGYDKPYTDGQFSVTSYHNGKTYQINGESDTITSTANTFVFDDKQISIDLIGGIGDLTLEIPRDITDSVARVTNVATCEDIPVQVGPSSSSDAIRVELEGVDLNTRAIALAYGDTTVSGCPESEEHDDDHVTTAPPSAIDITGNHIDVPMVGQQLILSTDVSNNLPQVQPFVTIVEVRDSDGITVFLAFQIGTLNPLGVANVGVSWTPDVEDTYTARTFTVSNLQNPSILSKLAESTITVGHADGMTG